MKPFNALKRFAFSLWLNRLQMPMKSWCLVVESHDSNERKCVKKLTAFKTCIATMYWRYPKNTHFENLVIANDLTGFTQSMRTSPIPPTIGRLNGTHCLRIHAYLDSILDCLQPYLDRMEILQAHPIEWKHPLPLWRQTVKVNGVCCPSIRWFELNITKTRPLISWRCLWKEHKTSCRLSAIIWTSVQWTFPTHFQTTLFWCLVKHPLLNRPLHWRMSFHR